MMLAYLMLFTALFNAACLYNDCLFFLFYFALDFCIVIIYTNYFSSCFVFGLFTHSLVTSIIFCIMYRAFHQLVYLILCSHCFYFRKGYMLSGEIALYSFQKLYFSHLRMLCSIDSIHVVYKK